LKKLGWGHFSTVWLAFNIKDRQLYALKVMRAQEKYIYVGFAEEAINRLVAENFDHPDWVYKVRQRRGKGSELFKVTKDDNYCLQM
jgi:serine/threonine protein kinase